jgi:hypothetical protein
MRRASNLVQSARMQSPTLTQKVNVDFLPFSGTGSWPLRITSQKAHAVLALASGPSAQGVDTARRSVKR